MRLLLDPAREPVAQPRPGGSARAASGGARIHGDRPPAAGAGLRRRRGAAICCARTAWSATSSGWPRRGCATRRWSRWRSPRARSAAEVAIEALPAGDAGASDVIMLRGRNLGGLVAGEGHRMARKPRDAEAAAEAAPDARVAARCGTRDGGPGTGPRSGISSPRSRGCAVRDGTARRSSRAGGRISATGGTTSPSAPTASRASARCCRCCRRRAGAPSASCCRSSRSAAWSGWCCGRRRRCAGGAGGRTSSCWASSASRCRPAAREALRERQPPLRHGGDGQRLEERAFRRRGRGLRQGLGGGGRARPARRDGCGAEHAQPAGARADGAAQGDRRPHLLRAASRGAHALGQSARHRPYGAGL